MINSIFIHVFNALRVVWQLLLVVTPRTEEVGIPPLSRSGVTHQNRCDVVPSPTG